MGKNQPSIEEEQYVNYKKCLRKEFLKIRENFKNNNRVVLVLAENVIKYVQQLFWTQPIEFYKIKYPQGQINESLKEFLSNLDSIVRNISNIGSVLTNPSKQIYKLVQDLETEIYHEIFDGKKLTNGFTGNPENLYEGLFMSKNLQNFDNFLDQMDQNVKQIIASGKVNFDGFNKHEFCDICYLLWDKFPSQQMINFRNVSDWILEEVIKKIFKFDQIQSEIRLKQNIKIILTDLGRFREIQKQKREKKGGEKIKVEKQDYEKIDHASVKKLFTDYLFLSEMCSDILNSDLTVVPLENDSELKFRVLYATEKDENLVKKEFYFQRGCEMLTIGRNDKQIINDIAFKCTRVSRTQCRVLQQKFQNFEIECNSSGGDGGNPTSIVIEKNLVTLFEDCKIDIGNNYYIHFSKLDNQINDEDEEELVTLNKHQLRKLREQKRLKQDGIQKVDQPIQQKAQNQVESDDEDEESNTKQRNQKKKLEKKSNSELIQQKPIENQDEEELNTVNIKKLREMKKQREHQALIQKELQGKYNVVLECTAYLHFPDEFPKIIKNSISYKDSQENTVKNNKTFTIGKSEGCDIQIQDGELPDVALTIEYVGNQWQVKGEREFISPGSDFIGDYLFCCLNLKKKNLTDSNLPSDHYALFPNMKIAFQQGESYAVLMVE